MKQEFFCNITDPNLLVKKKEQILTQVNLEFQRKKSERFTEKVSMRQLKKKNI